MTTETTPKDDITYLAELAYDAIRPASGNDKPYAIERMFRESVKAVKESNKFRIDADEAALRITGRLQKLPDRSDQVYRVSREDSEHGGHLNERIERFAEAFAQRLLIDWCEGKPSLLKRRANGFADGFYAATLQLKYQSSDENSAEMTDEEST
jgi:CRISPR-associated protein Csc3